MLSLRGGTRFGAGDYAGSAGGSLHLPLMGRRASIDYGFSRYSLLGNVHALGLRFGM